MLGVHLYKLTAAGMNSHLRSWQLEDQPSVAGIDRTKSENILKESAIGVGVFAVEQEVHAVNHTQSLAPVSLDRPSMGAQALNPLKLPTN